MNPNIEHIYQLRGVRPLLEDYVSLGMTTIPPSERYAHNLPGSLNHALFHASSVIDIQYMSDEPSDIRPSIYRPPPSVAPSSLTADEVILGMIDPCRPSDEWEAAGIRGVVVRTYSASITEHVLTHCRVLSRARERRYEYYVGTNRQWHEFTRYRGRRVPYTVISEMYGHADISPDWVTGAREMKLPRTAWEVLEKWFDTTSPQPEDDDTREGPPGMDHDGNHDQDSDEDDDFDDEDDDDDDEPYGYSDTMYHRYMNQDGDDYSEDEDNEDDEDVRLPIGRWPFTRTGDSLGPPTRTGDTMGEDAEEWETDHSDD